MSGTALARFDWEKAVRVAGLGTGKGGASVPLVALALATYADSDGTSVRPSQETLAAGLGVSRSTVTRAIRRLRDEGLLRLVREAGPGLAAEYELTVPCAPVHIFGAPVHGGSAPVHVFGAPVPQHQTMTRPGPEQGPDQEDPWSLAETLTPPSPTVGQPDDSSGGEVLEGWEAEVERQVTERDAARAAEPQRRSRYRNT